METNFTIMEKNFIQHFAEAIETDATHLTMETKFRELPEWDSLAYLSVIAMIDEQFDVVIDGNDFKKLNTLQELFDAIQLRKR